MVDTTNDDILLRVPARAPYTRVVRVGAAALALHRGMSFGEIDDLRLAIDELMTVLLDGVDDDSETDVNFVFRTAERQFELEATRTQGADVSEAAVHRFDAIASGLVDDYDIDPGHAWIRIRKTLSEEGS